MAKYGTAGETTAGILTRCMRFAGRIIKATDPHSEYVILIVFHGNSGYVNAPQYYVYVHITYDVSLYVYRNKREYQTALIGAAT